jgi:two-component system sensor histidine kinase UhpB
MSTAARDRLAAIGTGLILLFGILVWALGRPTAGLTSGLDARGRVVVVSVSPGSLGWEVGARPGMLIVAVGERPPSPSDRFLDGQRIELLDEVSGAAIRVKEDTDMHGLVPGMVLVAGMQAAGAWLLRRRLSGSRSAVASEAAVTLAIVAPLALMPGTAFGSPLAFGIAALAWPLSVAPLVLLLADRATSADEASRVRRISGGSLAAAIATTPLLFFVPGPATQVVLLREALVAVALLVPVVLAASSNLRSLGAWIVAGAADAGPIGLAAIALAPLAVRLLTTVPLEGATVIVVSFGVGAAAFLIRFGIVPLMRVAASAVKQRDLVAEGAEAERRRMAADLHDGPLQSLTLLAYRLEAAGDGENADFARDITTELRAITSSLRLPVVDDLGTGPALEWLTERVGRLAGTTIDLERLDDGRPPLEVEHAIFRVAQEALANAARHGRPPIQVRYEADALHASLVVSDAGDGALVKPRDGRGLGIVGMRERAHAIGADFEMAQTASGMKVSLIWPRPA